MMRIGATEYAIVYESDTNYLVATPYQSENDLKIDGHHNR